MNFQKSNVNQNNLVINLIFCLFPLTYILGNTAINLNVFFLILCSLFLFFKDFVKSLKNINKLIIIFFFYILFTGTLNTIEFIFLKNLNIVDIDEDKNNFYILLKSFAYLRYLLLFLVIKYLIENQKIKLSIFFLSSGILCLFVSFDIIIQFFFSKNLFGIKPINSRHFSGIFGNELIAGSYLQKYFLFFLFFLIIFVKQKKLLFLSVAISSILISSGIILSGNRMPLLLFILSLFLLFIFYKPARKYLIFFVIILSLIFYTILNKNKNLKLEYKFFFDHSYTLLSSPFKKNIDRYKMPDYFHEFESFYDTWKLNKYFGGGVKSFRINCPLRKNIKIDERGSCNTHPHNYYLETLTEIGVIGLSVLLLLLYNVFRNTQNYISKCSKKQKLIILPFFILFITEIFPIKSTGSFYSTFNSTYIFLIIGCLSGLYSKKIN